MSGLTEITQAAQTAHPHTLRPEHERRMARTQEVLRGRGLDALVVTDPANLYYLTGYNAWSFYMPQALLVPAQGEAHLVLRAMDAKGGHHTATLPRDRIHGYPEHYVHRHDIHPWEWIASTGREVGVLPSGAGTIAMELDAHFFSPRAYLAFGATLPQAEVVDSQELVNWKTRRLIDCLSVVARPGSAHDRPTEVVRNPDFMREAARLAAISRLYAR